MKAPRSLNPVFEALNDGAINNLSNYLKVATHPADVMPGLLGWYFGGDLKKDLLDDLVSMSLKASVKVNFKWSWSRIRDEHDRAARLITLQEMKLAPVVYDIPEEMDSMVPGFKPIKTNIRLGIEGLRQRHCVVERKDKIESGRIVIFSGVVNGKRWTMTYSITSSSFTEIKGWRNETPPSEVKEAITRNSGIEFTSIEDIERRVLGYFDSGFIREFQPMRFPMKSLREATA